MLGVHNLPNQQQLQEQCSVAEFVPLCLCVLLSGDMKTDKILLSVWSSGTNKNTLGLSP